MTAPAATPARRTRQCTVAGELAVEGVGIHSGESVSVRVKPADAGTGIVFRRADEASETDIPARLDSVAGTELGVVLEAGGSRVHTVEHLLAALAACAVDNALVEVGGPEIPILDGSFAPWLRLLRDAGTSEQDQDAPVVALAAPVTTSHAGGASYVALPHDGFRVSATIDFDHGLIGRQYADFDIDAACFESDIAPARTFGFRADARALRTRGFARGASLNNTVVLDGDEVISGDLRYPDEFVRHKVGDLVGDLSLLGARVRGHVIAHRPGHTGNMALAAAIAEAHRKAQTAAVDVGRIMEYLPHRYPMLLVDRIIDFESGRRIVGLKNVTINEPFFRGHFPGHPIMPGVLVIEAMAQVGGLLLMDSVDDPSGKVVYFMALNNVKWRRPVLPGDQIVFEVEMKALRRQVCRMKGRGRVDGRVVAEAEMTARIVDR